jgi:WD40 repeat protein
MRRLVLKIRVTLVAVVLATGAVANADQFAPGTCETLRRDSEFANAILREPDGRQQKRVALVVGNGAYTNIRRLANPANDARAVAKRLASLGFTVVLGIDLQSSIFADCLDGFYRQLPAADAALLYYAGHGIQVASKNPTTRVFEARNYMLAVDSHVEQGTGNAVGFLQVDGIVARMRQAAPASLLFLDACRDNPLTGTDIRLVDGRSAESLGRGVTVMKVQEEDVQSQAGLYLAYATSPNNTAADGSGRHSPFTRAFLDHVATPGEPLDTVMTRVKQGVGDATDWMQTPWTNSSLNLDFHFNGKLTRRTLATASRDIAQSAGDLLAQGRRGEAIATALKGLPVHVGAGPTAETAAAYAMLYRSFHSPVQALIGHSKEIDLVRFSDDGSRVLTTSEDRTARIWDAQSGIQASIYRLRGYKIYAAKFLSSGPRIVTADLDDTSRIRDAATGKIVSVLKGIDDPFPGSGLFTDDGQHFVTINSSGRSILWDVATGRKIATFSGTNSYARNAALSPSGGLFGTAHDDKVARIWDLRTGTLLDELRGHSAGVWDISFATDPTIAGTASDDRTARIWRRTNGRYFSVHVLRGHSRALRSIVFSPNDDKVLTTALDRTVRLWDPASGAELVKLDHEKWVTTAVFSESGDRVITGANDGILRFWSVATGKLIDAIDGHTSQISSIVPSHSDDGYATGSDDGTVRIWRGRDSGGVVPILAGATTAKRAVFLGTTGRVAASGNDGVVRILDASTGRSLHTLSGHTAEITFLGKNSKGTRLLTGSRDMTARMWDVRTGRTLAVFGGHSDTEFDPAEGVTRPPDEEGNLVNHGLFLDDGDRVVTTARRDRVARIWDAGTGRQLSGLAGHTNRIAGIAASPDQRWLVTASNDGTARIWDAATGKSLRVLADHGSAVMHAEFSPDGTQILTASLDSTARIWNAATGAMEQLMRSHSGPVLRARFSSDGATIVTLGSGGEIKVWEVRSGRLRSTMRAPRSTGSYDIVFSPDDVRLLSSVGNTSLLWDAHTGVLLSRLEGWALDSVEHTFSPDGSRVLVGGYYQPAAQWHIGAYDQRLIDMAYQQLRDELRDEVDRQRLRYWELRE